MVEPSGVLMLVEAEAAQRPVAVQIVEMVRTLVVSRMELPAAPDSHNAVRFSSGCDLHRLQFHSATREEDQSGKEADSATREVRTAAGTGNGL